MGFGFFPDAAQGVLAVWERLFSHCLSTCSLTLRISFVQFLAYS